MLNADEDGEDPDERSSAVRCSRMSCLEGDWDMQGESKPFKESDEFLRIECNNLGIPGF